MTIPGYVVEFQTAGGLWVPQYATADRQRLGEFIERMFIPDEGDAPRVIRISRILLDGAVQ